MPVITTNGRARARQLEMNLKRKQAIKKANQQANSNSGQCGCVPCEDYLFVPLRRALSCCSVELGPVLTWTRLRAATAW